jgi:diguanylate cyclase (GGDEF)-like protein
VRALSRGPLAILMGDLDNFKALNDSRGHLVGDEVLGEVGRVIRDTLRIGDMAARWGGEEFTVTLPGMTMEHATQVAERLRREVAAPTAATSAVTMSIGVSVVAMTPMDDADDVLEQALHDADRAMYLAKAQGRNRVAVTTSRSSQSGDVITRAVVDG